MYGTMVGNIRGASPFVATMWSPERQQDKNTSFQVTSYSSSSSSISLHDTSLRSSVCSDSLHAEDLVASHRYLPNEHHRIIANASPEYCATLAPRSENIPGLNNARCVPMLSRDAAVHRYSSLGIALDDNIGCQNNQLVYENSNRGAGEVPENNEFASPEVRMPSDINGTQSCIYSEVMKPSNEDYNLTVNFDGSSHSSDMQTNQQPTSVSRSRVMCSNIDTQSHASRRRCLSQTMLNKDVQPFSQKPYTSHSQFDEHQLLLKEKCDLDRYALGEETGSNLLRSQRFLNGPSQINSYTRLEQTAIEPSSVNIFLDKQHQSLLSVEERSSNHSSEFKEVEMAYHSKMTQKQDERNILLLYEHVQNCQNEGQECVLPRCRESKRIFAHVLRCRDSKCNYGCFTYNQLINHYRDCCKSTCATCGPVRMRLNKVFEKRNPNAGSKTAFPTIKSIEQKHSVAKRIKTAHPPPPAFKQNKTFQVPLQNFNCNPQSAQVVAQPVQEQIMTLDSETDTGQQVPSKLTEFSKISDTGNKDEDVKVETKIEVSPKPSQLAQVAVHSIQENMISNEFPTVKMDESCKLTPSADFSVSLSKMGYTQKKVASLLHTFTHENLREHIRSLGHCMDQGKSKVEKAQIRDHLMDENLCSLCGTDKLLFEPSPKYCACCLKLINSKGVYYFMRSHSCSEHEDNTGTSFCGKCYGASGESIKFGGKSFRKVNLEKRLNYAETDAEPEWWVQCGKCKSWQHTICALFNRERKEELQGEYTCASCYLQELESGKCEPLPQNSVPGAKDLPKTTLSNHIEKWVLNRLEQEREQRAQSLGKRIDEVPGAEGLVIRVVSSINKKLDVNPLFHEIFVDENYPSEFPYKSKAILLFQNIEGSDVCLFAMYVQEYGSECPHPNQRRVCISYIDSVKYFRPEVKAVTGEALRTFVYHEILIGYLDYSKKRGFTSCYMWSCPPEREDYYVLFCHPKIQKSPKPDKLREWYQSMIRKAMKENIILEKTNLHEHFFVLASECKAKVTAARLPYFDSDYWPGQAEILLQKENKNEVTRKGTKAVIERALRAAKRDASTGKPKDILLMHQLGEKFQKMKEDFVMVHLQPECRHCCQPIVCGKQWLCSACKNFHLCEQCHDKELKLEKKDKHPVTSREKHSFQLVETDILGNTSDKDEIMQSEYFDMRTVFLSFCQSNHYQFDSLRRAKHSTMMILYHLHSALNLSKLCAACLCDVVTDESWFCLTCPGYVLCPSCFHQHGSSLHEHELVSHAISGDCVLVGKEGNTGMAEMQILDAMVHASRCPDTICTYPCCRKVKRIFYHSKVCTTHLRGGCQFCKAIWDLILLHAPACRELECRVPRCSDLKDYIRRKKQQKHDCRRRDSAKDKISQQEGEVPG